MKSGDFSYHLLNNEKINTTNIYYELLSSYQIVVKYIIEREVFNQWVCGPFCILIYLFGQMNRYFSGYTDTGK